MPRLEWDETLETGDSAVDEQHQHLVEMFNQLHDAAVEGRGRDTIDEILRGLAEYVSVHFAAEERLMLRTGYPPAATSEHLRQHADLTAKTVEMIHKHRAGELTTVLPLAIFLQDWLGTHIRKSDRALVNHVRSVTGDAGAL